MKTTTNQLIVTACAFALGITTHAAVIADVDFDNATDLANNFVNSNGVTTEDGTGDGLSGSGGVDLVNSGNAFVYNTPVGGGHGRWGISMFFYTDDPSNTGNRGIVGFTENSNDTWNGAFGGDLNTTDNEVYAALSGVDGAGLWNVVIELDGDNEASSASFALADESWYFLSLSVGEASGGDLTDVTASVYSSSGSGSVGSLLGSATAASLTTTLATDNSVYGFFASNTSPNNGIPFADNFSMSNSVPEPGSLALIGIGGLLLRMARRRRG